MTRAGADEKTEPNLEAGPGLERGCTRIDSESKHRQQVSTRDERAVAENIFLQQLLLEQRRFVTLVLGGAGCAPEIIYAVHILILGDVSVL